MKIYNDDITQEEIIRINLNVPRKLLNSFDTVVKRRYTSRTELIKSLMYQAVENDIQITFKE